MIDVQNLSKQHKNVEALKSINFQVGQGEELVIMGPSGSGKTTLVNLLAGLDTPSSGRIVINGTEITALTAGEMAEFRRENIGIIFQEFHLIEYLTALENVMLAQYFHSMPDEEDAMRSLEKVGLKNRADHLPAQLSGGEQQRVAIARAITNEPRLLLADEPTGNLDEANERIMLDIFKELKQQGHTLITVTHNLILAEHCDLLFELDHGDLIKQTTISGKKSPEPSAT